jgi:hypothetical protein
MSEPSVKPKIYLLSSSVYESGATSWANAGLKTSRLEITLRPLLKPFAKALTDTPENGKSRFRWANLSYT